MASIFEKLRLKARKRVDDAVVSFEQLVRDIADGKDVAEPQVEKTLEASGRNVEALEAAVARLHRRREIEAQIVELPALQEQMRRIKKEAMPKLERELEETRKRIDGQLSKLAKQHGVLHGQVSHLMTLQTELMGLLPAAERAALVAARTPAPRGKPSACKPTWSTSSANATGWLTRSAGPRASLPTPPAGASSLSTPRLPARLRELSLNPRGFHALL